MNEYPLLGSRNASRTELGRFQRHFVHARDQHAEGVRDNLAQDLVDVSRLGTGSQRGSELPESGTAQMSGLLRGYNSPRIAASVGERSEHRRR